MKTIKCPICKKSYISSGLSKHIVQQGQREIYKVYSSEGKVNRKSKNKPHEDFVKNNTVTIRKFSTRRLFNRN